ncbi:acetyl-CoA hydrolase/transferase C-terminal domain-containing protein [Dokdonella sp.]|uniref:acetyl-CoA hydrolase/transferase C-terminal domain-containing protein n=1 Tax=Dokdonella sp. TaxID=2291710 RepID=UPI001B2B3CA3|nr:acetyl-CoA hydrolase/transferase C-terminal domain-containing protein [Dokdonella sp.]MBO9664856.1 acetyl-CoA hydrolase [Dokdonella sp.]
MPSPPPHLSSAAAVDRLIERGTPHLAVAAPLGLGKPNRLLNALYARIKADPARRMTLYTALSLDPPAAGSELERRFLEPFLARQFGADYPRLDYVIDLKAGRLPANVRVQEFYFQSGAMLGSAQAQRDYASINYTQVARDLADDGLDAIVQLVARRGEGAAARYSLSCNPDVTLDVLDALAARGQPRPLVIGVVHPELPFLGGDAEVGPELFDALVEEAEPAQPLFALPRGAVDLAEHAIGLHASTLVRDGGTLQIGIGALSDAIVHALLLRQRNNADYLGALRALRGDDPAADALIARVGGLAPFARGLYGASEMVMDGFMHLRRAGILARRVYDDIELQRALDAGATVDAAQLRGGHYLKGAFYLGTKEFYDWLRTLDGEDYEGLAMCRVSDINQLYGGHEQLDAAQRRDARFFNTCMMASLLGAATSDALEDGRVVSGVGGQYNFVAMAHALAGGRSILLLRATRKSGRRVESNLRWNYGHTTIPRHLRDVYVTEYGVADLRGRSDEACVRAMLAISDARFVDALAAEAVRAGKLPRNFRVPDAWRANTPQALRDRLQPFAARGVLPTFPFGSDFDATERRVLPALLWLKSGLAEPRRWPSLLGALLAPGNAAEAPAVLERLDFARRDLSWRERLYARLVRGALARTKAIA